MAFHAAVQPELPSAQSAGEAMSPACAAAAATSCAKPGGATRSAAGAGQVGVEVRLFQLKTQLRFPQGGSREDRTPLGALEVPLMQSCVAARSKQAKQADPHPKMPCAGGLPEMVERRAASAGGTSVPAAAPACHGRGGRRRRAAGS